MSQKKEIFQKKNSDEKKKVREKLNRPLHRSPFVVTCRYSAYIHIYTSSWKSVRRPSAAAKFPPRKGFASLNRPRARSERLTSSAASYSYSPPRSKTFIHDRRGRAEGFTRGALPVRAACSFITRKWVLISPFILSLIQNHCCFYVNLRLQSQPSTPSFSERRGGCYVQSELMQRIRYCNPLDHSFLNPIIFR